jgi:hypothetical protein
MTIKFDNFIAALEILLREHSVTIAASHYDALQIWDYRGEGKDCYLDFDGVQDRTDPTYAK